MYIIIIYYKMNEKYKALVSKKGSYIKKVKLEYINEELVLLAVSENGLVLEFVPAIYQNNKDIVLAACLNNYKAIKYASLHVQKDREFMKNIMEKYNIVKYINPLLYNDKEMIMLLIKYENLWWDQDYENCQNITLKYASDEFKNDYEIVLSAIKKSSYSLQYASKELQNNYNIVLTAVNKKGRTIKYASIELRNNYNIVLAAIKEDIECVRYISKTLLDNENIILTGIKSNKYHTLLILEHVSDRLRNNYDIVLNAVIKNHNNYKYAPLIFRMNENIIFEAICQNPSIVKIIPKSAFKNESVFYNLVKKIKEIKSDDTDYNLIELYTLLLKKTENKKVIINLIKIDKHIFKGLSKDQQNDKSFLLEIIKQEMYVYELLPLKVLEDKEFVIKCYNLMDKTQILNFLDLIINKLYNSKTNSIYKSEELKFLQNNIKFFNHIHNINTENYNLTFIKNNAEILHLLNKNVVKYLIEKKEYKIIYDNEELSKISKEEFNTIIMSNIDINIDNEYDELEIEAMQNLVKIELS